MAVVRVRSISSWVHELGEARAALRGVMSRLRASLLRPDAERCAFWPSPLLLHKFAFSTPPLLSKENKEERSGAGAWRG